MGAEFKSASLWMKLAFIFGILAFGLHLFSMDTPGWAQYGCAYGTRNTGCNFYYGVEIMEVIAFIFVLTAVILVLCLVLLDELQGNKIAMICFIIFSFIAAIGMIIGVIIYEAQRHITSQYSTMLCIITAIPAILGAVFAILELVGVSSSKK